MRSLSFELPVMERFAPWPFRSNPAPKELVPAERPFEGEAAYQARWGNGRIYDACWSPNGRLLSVASALGIAVYDPATLQRLVWIPSATPIEQVAFLQQEMVVVGVTSEALIIWRLDGPELVSSLAIPAHAPRGVLFAHDGAYVAVDTGETTTVLRTQDGQQVAVLPGGGGYRGALAFAVDSRRLAITCNGAVRVWDATAAASGEELAHGVGPISALAFAPNSAELVIAAGAGIQAIPTDGGLGMLLVRGAESVRQIATNQKRDLIALLCGSAIELRRASDGGLVQALQLGHLAPSKVAFDPDGRQLAVVGSGFLQIWSVEDGALARELDGHWGGVKSVALSSDGRTLATVSDDATLWQATDNAVLHRFPIAPLRGQGCAVTFMPDGKGLALATDTQIQIRRISDGACLHVISTGIAQTDGMAFTVDGRSLVTLSLDAVRVWRLADGSLTATLRRCMEHVYDVALATDAMALAAVGDRNVRVWSIRDEVLRFVVQTDVDINGVALAHGMALLAIASDEAVELRQLGLDTRRFVLPVGAERLRFSPDGAVLAAAQGPNVTLWRVRDGSKIEALHGHTDSVTSLVFSADSQSLLTGSRDGTVRLWCCPYSKSFAPPGISESAGTALRRR